MTSSPVLDVCLDAIMSADRQQQSCSEYRDHRIVGFRIWCCVLRPNVASCKLCACDESQVARRVKT